MKQETHCWFWSIYRICFLRYVSIFSAEFQQKSPIRCGHCCVNTHSCQSPEVTAVSWLRRPGLALRVRIKRLLHFLLLPLLSAAAFGPFRHLAEEAEIKEWAASSAPLTKPPQTEAETWADYSSVAMNASAWAWCSQTKPAVRSAFRSDSQRTNSVHTNTCMEFFLSFLHR